MQIVNLRSEVVNGKWLPDMDLNHDKQIQSLLCYRYTIGQTDASKNLKTLSPESSRQTLAWLTRAHPETATAGPRTVPVRSSIAGGKAQECSRPLRPSDVQRAGTARAPVGVSRCARLTLNLSRRDRGTLHRFVNRKL